MEGFCADDTYRSRAVTNNKGGEEACSSHPFDLPLDYLARFQMLLLRLNDRGFSAAVPKGPAMAHQNNLYHDAQLDHLETGLNLILFLTPQS